MIDRFSVLRSSIPIRTTTALKVASQFIDHYMIPYGGRHYLLFDNRPPFLANFFESISACRQVNHFKTMPYHLETIDQVKRFNSTLTTKIRCYLSEHQNDWCTYVPVLTYAKNTQVHASTGLVSFELTLTCYPRTSDLGFGSTTLTKDSLNSPTPQFGNHATA